VAEVAESNSGICEVLEFFSMWLSVRIKQMQSSPTTKFCKTATCPSAEILLKYRDSGVAGERRRAIENHLSACDFCSAEFQLLKSYRVEIRREPRAEIPAAVRHLAEHLLKRSKREFKPFADLTKLPQLSH